MRNASKVFLGWALVAGLTVGNGVQAGTHHRSTAISGEAAAAGASANWVGYGGSSDEDHFSSLREITAENVDRLKLAWYYNLKPMISSFGAPLAVNGTVYAGLGYSVIYAFDGASGKLLWRYDPRVTAVAGEKLQAAWGIRGIAYAKGLIYTGTQDGRLIAIDAHTGRPVWSVQTTQGPRDGRYITGAPRVFDGKVIIGNGGGDVGPVRGYVSAYDARTGKFLWRFYTVPGNPAKGFENSAMKMAATTWHGHWWKFGGGGTVWNAIAYDAELHRIYIGTGNGDPWNQRIRSPGGGDNLFVCSIVALDADTGKYIWHYQTTPGDTWDFDATSDIELATLRIDGRDHRVLMQASKNGFFYVIDRANGKLLSAAPFTKVTWATGIDLQTGRPIEAPNARFPTGNGVVQPGATGGHNWEAMAFSPASGLAYIPTTLLPFNYDADGINVHTWHPTSHLQSNTGYQVFELKNPPAIAPGPLGALEAWNPVTQHLVWSVPLQAPYNGGVAATAGGVVFEGNAQGRLVAYDAHTGKILWNFNAQDGIIGQPILYQVHGHEYLTVITGFTGLPAALGPQVAQLGWTYRGQPRRVLTFSLAGKASLPPAKPRVAQVPAVEPKEELHDAVVARGVALYGARCFYCHGLAVVSGGGAPDLRISRIPLDPHAFAAVVQGGALESQGMPRFGKLTKKDLEAIREYIRYRAREDAHRH